MKSFKEFILGEADIIVEPVVEPIIDNEELEDISDELLDIISDMSDEEKEILLAHAYALVLLGNEDEDSEEDKDEELEETIQHLTGAERTQGKMQRRMPKWKKKAKIRYIKNKKCPIGTTWSSAEKSCTRINIDLSRLQKMISKMKIRQG